MPVKKYY